MNFFEDIAVYLPKYLSDDSSNTLKEELKRFPTDGTKGTIYTSELDKEEILFQGDGIAALKIVDLINQDFKITPAILLSNTCDMDTRNNRIFATQICYAPIINLERYISNLHSSLLRKGHEEKKASQIVKDHLNDIKLQRITQVLFLPKGGRLENDSLVFLDRIFNIDTKHIDRKNLALDRLFTLSDYGLYLFLLKLSIHFTRIQERIDRFKGTLL